MKRTIAVQGDVGSACEMAAKYFIRQLRFADIRLHYLSSAERVVEALENESVEMAVIARESPLGSLVEETDLALAGRAPKIVSEAKLEVLHAILAKRIEPFSYYQEIYSHPIPLAKHSEMLQATFPYAKPISFEDSGAAARALAEGALPDTALVIAMPSASLALGLQVLIDSLPNNQGYLTLFQLINGFEN